MPPATQVKLLRVLQERQGASRWASTAEVPFDVRVIAATNRDSTQEVKAGRFREDLFYRLNVITDRAAAAARARARTSRELAEFFLAPLAEDLGRPGLSFSAEALAVLRAYAFPGNVRQLQNIVERAATLAESDVLGPETLPPTLRGEQPDPAARHRLGGARRALLAGEAPGRGRAAVPAGGAQAGQRGEDARRGAAGAHASGASATGWPSTVWAKVWRRGDPSR